MLGERHQGHDVLSQRQTAPAEALTYRRTLTPTSRVHPSVSLGNKIILAVLHRDVIAWITARTAPLPSRADASQGARAMAGQPSANGQ